MATPIGNLRDVTLRALDVLKSVDLIAAEDTRVTRRLLAHYGISSEIMALHGHNEVRAAPRILDLLHQGRSVALVSDAGTPAVSDPGALLVRDAWDAGFRVIPVPGASALIAGLSAAGCERPGFVFVGFLPAQAGARRKALAALAPLPWELVFYEAPHRLREALADMHDALGPARELTLARELTKLFETIQRGTLGTVNAWLEQDPNRLRGEFVLIVQGNPAAPTDAAEALGERALQVLLEELPVAQAVRLAARIGGARKNELYRRALEIKQGG